MPASERETAPPDNVSVEKPKLSPIDRLANIGNEISKATQQGLSYANARRARDTYKPI